MVEQLLIHINRYALCKTTDKILLAVSGGIDSMVMLHLFREAGFNIGVAHCNYNLRGKESEADEQLVRLTCEKADVSFHIKKFETAAYSTEQRISIQMAARDLRYRFFQEVMTKEGFDYVATAHHFNDVIESVLMNIVRGTGMEGLTGIATKKQKIIRPLLFATRTRLHQYALDHHISWREDASNLSDDYQRNFIRHQIIPRLQELNPNFEETFRDTHARLLGGVHFSRAYVRSFETAAVEVSNTRTFVEIRKIRQIESPEVMLWELIKELGFNFDQCRKVVTDHQPGKVFFSQTHQLVVDRDHYIIEKKRSSEFLTVTIEKDQTLGGQPPHLLKLSEIMRADFRMNRDPAIAQLDADQLKFPLVWRRWRAGDYFTPLGMGQEKKLSDFLIDLKIPFNSKADITVLESAGDIVWVVGYRISERYKVTPDTKRILRVEQNHSAA